MRSRFSSALLVLVLSVFTLALLSAGCGGVGGAQAAITNL